ncbi:MAG: helix-turn-helix transcriptional regulator [Alphaproteobacteria bacterium]|nr:helix-turn-helix transcriptional regulator [Alphaproteobacteria bacterium]
MTHFRTLEAKSVLAHAEMWTDAHPPTLLTPAEVWNIALLSTCNLESYKDLAGIRGISDRTIAAQMRSARLKLGAKTNLFAVAEALRRQLIPSFERWEPGLPQAEILSFPRARVQAQKA